MWQISASLNKYISFIFPNCLTHTFVLLNGEHGQSVNYFIGGQRSTQGTAKDILGEKTKTKQKNELQWNELHFICSWNQKNTKLYKHLSQYFHHNRHHSILFGEALERHVPGRPTGADKDVSTGCLKGNILHVGPHPAVGLTEHGLWSQSGRHQKDVFAFHAAIGRTRLLFTSVSK